MKQNLIPVPFRGATLYVVSHEGQPFVPMKPIVEGMGLTWATQTVKLNSNKARWGVSIIETPLDPQPMLCIPLRKLPGWSMSVHPNKVNPEARDSIIAYQNECDDVLWQYWSQGTAVNPRLQPEKATVVGQPRLARDLAYTCRIFDRCQDVFTKKMLATSIQHLADQIGIPSPDVAFINQPVSQYRMEI